MLVYTADQIPSYPGKENLRMACEKVDEETGARHSETVITFRQISHNKPNWLAEDPSLRSG
jgi:hypothetical protein